jgi:hypothetical protein
MAGRKRTVAEWRALVDDLAEHVRATGHELPPDLAARVADAQPRAAGRPAGHGRSERTAAAAVLATLAAERVTQAEAARIVAQELHVAVPTARKYLRLLAAEAQAMLAAHAAGGLDLIARDATVSGVEQGLEAARARGIVDGQASVDDFDVVPRTAQ